MDFAFSEEQELLRKTARDFLAQRAPMKHVRAMIEDERGYSPELWREIAELGWAGLVLPEAHGGAGLSWVDAVALLEELGRALTPLPLLPTWIAGAALLEAGDAAQQSEWLGRIAAGRALATLALAEEAGSEDPGALGLEARRSGAGWKLSGRKLFVPDAHVADLLLVVARTGGEGERGLGLFAVPRESRGVAIAPLRSMDPLRRLSEVRLEGVALAPEALLGGDSDAWPRLRRVLDRALVMICAESLGGAQQCLDDAVRYAKERVQFGRPIGVNQAVKHKCADMLFEVESSRSIVHYAAWAAREAHPEAELSAAMAKAYVSDAYTRVAADGIQLHGGVGFTWEYDCHLYFKRAKTNEVWLGDASHHRERVARLLAL